MSQLSFKTHLQSDLLGVGRLLELFFQLVEAAPQVPRFGFNEIGIGRVGQGALHPLMVLVLERDRALVQFEERVELSEHILAYGISGDIPTERFFLLVDRYDLFFYEDEKKGFSLKRNSLRKRCHINLSIGKFFSALRWHLGIYFYLFYLFISITQARICFRMNWQWLTLMWACIRNVYLIFLGNRRSSTRLI